MSEHEAHINREPTIGGFTPEQLKNLAKLAMSYGLPQASGWALVEHSVIATNPEIKPLALRAKDTHPDPLILGALHYLKRGSRRQN